ncbi:polysaccharide deacetylase family protein [Azospirillum palustre]
MAEPSPSAPVLTTSWDDGHPLDMRLAEMLLRHGVTGTFYVPGRNRADRPVMAAADLRELAAAGFEIGSHTADHRRLPGLSRADAGRQMADGRAALEDILGRPVEGFCFPGGRPGRWGRLLARELGFSHARTTQMLRIDAGADPFAMATTAQIYPHRPAALLRNWLRHGGGGSRLAILRALALRGGAAQDVALGDALAVLARRTALRRGVFHLWGHSWEIEARGLWGALDRALAAAAAAFPAESRVVNRALVTLRPVDAPPSRPQDGFP